MIEILMMSAKLASPGLPKVKVFSNKGHDVNFSWCYLSYNVEVVMWPKFGNSSVSVREVITSFI